VGQPAEQLVPRFARLLLWLRLPSTRPGFSLATGLTDPSPCSALTDLPCSLPVGCLRPHPSWIVFLLPCLFTVVPLSTPWEGFRAESVFPILLLCLIFPLWLPPWKQGRVQNLVLPLWPPPWKQGRVQNLGIATLLFNYRECNDAY
jgi:hypothetical protein